MAKLIRYFMSYIIIIFLLFLTIEGTKVKISKNNFFNFQKKNYFFWSIRLIWPSCRIFRPREHSLAVGHLAPTSPHRLRRRVHNYGVDGGRHAQAHLFEAEAHRRTLPVLHVSATQRSAVLALREHNAQRPQAIEHFPWQEEQCEAWRLWSSYSPCVSRREAEWA